MYLQNSVKFFRRAFSLIEMLIVMAVIGLLLAMATPDLFSLIQSSSLSAEGETLRNRLTRAQQSALSTNADVEVRFFKYSDVLDAQVNPLYQAYQFFNYNRVGQLVPMSQLFRIKSPIVIHDGLSTLLTYNTTSDEKEEGYSPSQGTFDIPVGSEMVRADYIAFRFRPDGSTDLPNRPADNEVWYVTLVQGEGAAASSQVPDNFFTIQIDAFNGRLTEFRP